MRQEGGHAYVQQCALRFVTGDFADGIEADDTQVGGRGSGQEDGAGPCDCARATLRARLYWVPSAACDAASALLISSIPTVGPRGGVPARRKLTDF